MSTIAATSVGNQPGRFIGDVRGQRPGPTLVLIGGLHANEPSGVEAAERVLSRFNEEGSLYRGRLVALRGNLPALAAPSEQPWLRPRYLDTDLNRAFTAGPGTGSMEWAQRNELVSILSKIASESKGRPMLMDLHTFSSDAPAFIAIEDSLPARRFAEQIGLPKILGLEEELGGLLIDYATNELGYVSCIVESGRHDDPESVRVHEAAIITALRYAGLIDKDFDLSFGLDSEGTLERSARGRGRHFYEVLEHQRIEGTDYRTADGIEAFARVEAGRSVIGTESGRQLTARATGLVFMPNRQAAPSAGDDAFFVVRRIGRGWVLLSGLLRSREWVHAALPALLPGVRDRPGRKGEILVAPEIAVILRAQLLHLLGYRLVRWSHPAPAGPVRRFCLAIHAVARALWMMVVGLWAGGEPAALSAERPEDWVARRRRLDVETTSHH